MFRITDNGEGGYRVALLSDPSYVRNADTYGLAEAYGHEMVEAKKIEARNVVYDQIDEDRLLADANALMAKKRGRPRKIVIVEDEPEAPVPARIEGAPVDEDAAS